MSAINLAGFIVYRISPRKPIEYLLLNNSYEHRAHWYPPKGKRNSNEDELKAAVRETFAQTELQSQDYVTDSAFRAELKYVDGIKPKQVVYFLARFAPSPTVTSHLCDSSGLKYQWCALGQALDKVVFQSMQNILTQAEDYIEGIREEILTGNSRTRWQNEGDDERRTYRGEQNENGASTWRTSRDDAGGIDGRFKKMSVNDGQRGPRNYGDRDQQPQQPAQGQWKEASGGGSSRDNSGSSQQRRPQDNPLYKTRLCEKFEQEGECPYNQKCVFAHGAAELRVREVTPANEPRSNLNERQRDYASPVSPYQRQHQQQQSHQYSQQQQPQYYQQPRQHQQSMLSPQSQQFQQSARVSQNPGLKFNSNPLYKTRLCQRFTEQGDCPYNDKCQFAHGDQELRVAPDQPAQPQPQLKSPRESQYPPRTPTDQSSNGFNRGPFDMPQAWRKGQFDGASERSQAPRLVKNMSWSNTGAVAVSGESPSFSDDGSLEPPPGYPLSNRQSKTVDANDDEAKATPLAAPLITPAPQKIPAPASTKAAPTNIGNTATTKRQQEPRSGSLKSESGGERPWLKVVELSTEEMQQMGSPLVDTAPVDTTKQKQPSKTVSLESRLAKELTEFFAKEPTPQAAFKEITHVEFRNNLTKQQLLNICIATLFAPCKGLGVSDAISKHVELLSKVVSKQQDQAFMLNAWLRLMAEDEHAAAWQKKASEILGALYKESLLDEEVFTQWFDGKHSEDHGPAIASMQPFAHWLATAEEE